MLSGETAVGAFPVDAVTVMSNTAVVAESTLDYRELWKERANSAAKGITESIGQATVDISLDLGAAAIITPTSSGMTARAVSKYRPQVPIIAAAMQPETYRQLAISWGVYPIQVIECKNTDHMLDEAVNGAKKAGLVKDGDLVVLTAGVPVGVPGRTNLIKVHTISQSSVECGV